MHRSNALLVIVTTAVVSACSAKESATPDSSRLATQAGAPSGALKAGFDPTTHTAVIHARDYAFDSPDTITAGWTTVHLVNDGPGLHHAQLVRLDGGKTVADLEAAFKNPGPPPSWAVFVGGPNAPDPATQAEGVFNLAAGNYAIICVVDVPDHMPHVARGMVHPLTVAAATGPAAPEPVSDVAVVLSDYSFTVQGALTAGKHVVKVTNNGPQPHEVELIRLAPGKTVKDAGAWIDAPNGPPPMTGLGGVAVIMNGMTGYTTYDLTPGHYAMICFVPDAKDGKAHADHGMIKEFTIQ